MFHNNIVKILEILNKGNLLKIYLKFTYPTNFCIFCSCFYDGKMKIFECFKTNKYNKTFCVYIVTTNSFTLNHTKSLQIYFFCVTDVESTVSGAVSKTVE